jgi:hypothetical protein
MTWRRPFVELYRAVNEVLKLPEVEAQLEDRRAHPGFENASSGR